jgi:hypothetical protein
MKNAGSMVGRRVMVKDVFHSHSRTRFYKDQLIGRDGVIVAVLREGRTALVELDDDQSNCPAGARRWPFQWDDLLLDAEDAQDQPDVAYRAGFTWHNRRAVQHAVRPTEEVALCGQVAHPLPICGWSLTFSPDVDRACSICARLTDSLR